MSRCRCYVLCTRPSRRATRSVGRIEYDANPISIATWCSLSLSNGSRSLRGCDRGYPSPDGHFLAKKRHARGSTAQRYFRPLLSLTISTEADHKETRPPTRIPPGTAKIADDTDIVVPHPITACSVALCHHSVICLIERPPTSASMQQNGKLSDAGAAAPLHAACPVRDHARSCRVPGVGTAAHLRPSGSRKSSASMPRRLAASRLAANPDRSRRVL